MPPCRLRRRKFLKFDYEMVHSEVYLNKHVVSIAPFSTSACPDCSQNIAKHKTALFGMFSLFNLSSIFPGGGQLTLFVTVCGRPFIGNESVPIQLAQCWFPGLAISSDKT